MEPKQRERLWQIHVAPLVLRARQREQELQGELRRHFLTLLAELDIRVGDKWPVVSKLVEDRRDPGAKLVSKASSVCSVSLKGHLSRCCCCLPAYIGFLTCLPACLTM